MYMLMQVQPELQWELGSMGIPGHLAPHFARNLHTAGTLDMACAYAGLRIFPLPRV